MAHFDRAVPPGGEGKITLTVDLRGYNGDFRKDTKVTSNDPEKSSFALTVKGTVKPLFQVRPGSSITFKGIGDQVKDVTLEISTMSQPFRIEKVESNLEGNVSYDLQTVAEGQLYRLKVANLLKEGTYNGILKLVTDLPRKRDVEIRVSGRIEGEVAVRPKSIALGKLPSQDPVAMRNVVVLSNRNKPFKITKLEYDEKLIRVVAKQLPDRPGFDLEISTNVQSLPTGNSVETILNVQTDLDPEARHKVEVRLYNYQQ